MKALERKALERLYSRRYTAAAGFSIEQARELCSLSRRLGRQIGLLINRQGKPEYVILGTAAGLLIPPLGRSRLGQSRLRGLGLLHTHLSDDDISQEDLMDLLFLRLDFLSVLQADKTGAPRFFQYSHLLPAPGTESPYYLSPALPMEEIELNLKAQIEAVEQEMSSRQNEIWYDKCAARVEKAKKEAAARRSRQTPKPVGAGRAILVSVSKSARKMQERFLEELAELAAAAGVEVCGQMLYRPSEHQRSASRLLLGEGRLAELEVLALKTRADMIIFDGELSPAQIDYLARITERKVLDRTMLILDIFSQRANSRAGKLQVELAQLEYALPRLAGRNAGRAMDRLAGGIGGRGPGETKLELDRRRIRARMAKIKLEIKSLSQQRGLARSRREQAGLPVICLIGYTNTGKSTLLNKLTQSNVYVENQMFATLDSTARRLFVPGSPKSATNPETSPWHSNAPVPTSSELETVITDTVGFIRDLPGPLRAAFTATLEELNGASLLVHVADASHPDLDLQIESVQKIIVELGLDSIPCLLALNKWDLLSPEKSVKTDPDAENASADRMLAILERYPQSVPISAAQGLGLDFLKQKMAQLICTAAEYVPQFFTEDCVN